jgi:hypothetical protein
MTLYELQEENFQFFKLLCSRYALLSQTRMWQLSYDVLTVTLLIKWQNQNKSQIKVSCFKQQFIFNELTVANSLRNSVDYKLTKQAKSRYFKLHGKIYLLKCLHSVAFIGP